MHLSATGQFGPFQKPWTSISWGAYGLSYSEGLAQVVGNVQRWGRGGFKSVMTPCIGTGTFCFSKKLSKLKKCNHNYILA